MNLKHQLNVWLKHCNQWLRDFEAIVTTRWLPVVRPHYVKLKAWVIKYGVHYWVLSIQCIRRWVFAVSSNERVKISFGACYRRIRQFLEHLFVRWSPVVRSYYLQLKLRLAARYACALVATSRFIVRHLPFLPSWYARLKIRVGGWWRRFMVFVSRLAARWAPVLRSCWEWTKVRALDGSRRFRAFVLCAPWNLPLALAALAALLQLVITRPALSPRQWTDFSIACRLSPPVDALDGVWRLILASLHAVLSPNGVAILLWFVGALALALTLLVAERLFDWLLPSQLRTRLLAVNDGVFCHRLLVSGGAALFVSSEAVWESLASPGIASFRILVMLFAFAVAIWCVRNSRYYRLPLPSLVLGLLAGDGPFAAAVFAALFVFIGYRSRIESETEEKPLGNPIVLRAVTAWSICAFAFGVAATMVVNVFVYRAFGGVTRASSLVGDLVQSVAGDLLSRLMVAFAEPNVLFVMLFIALPAVIAVLAPRRIWPQRGTPSPLWTLPVVLLALLTISQMTGFGVANVWLAAAERAGAVSRANWHFAGIWVTLVLVMILIVRGSEVTDNLRLRRTLLVSAHTLLAVMLIFSLPCRLRFDQRQLESVIEDFCRETVRECADDRLVITDGTLDEGIELFASSEDCTLLTVSLVSGGDAREVKIRQRSALDREDSASLGSSGADALRDWMDLRTNRLEGVAAQAGYDRRRKYEPPIRPRVSGLVAHFGGETGDAERRGRAEARKLGWRVVKLCERGAPDGFVESAVVSRFRFVQWRIAETCRSRIRLADPERDIDEITADERLAAALERLNPELEELRRRHGFLAEHRGALILPREGVKLALAKHDFRMASQYAAEVLKVAPDDPEANFAMGMHHYLSRQFARAIPCLETVLRGQGENPAVLNNLALANLRIARFSEAIEYAKRAREAAPEDQNLRQSAERIIAAATARRTTE